MQPIGREICYLVGFPMPCQTEFDACKADPANKDKITSTGSLADKNLVYPHVGPPKRSTDPCHPEAALLGYKVAYNLTVSQT